MSASKSNSDFWAHHFPTFHRASGRPRRLAHWISEDRTLKLLRRIDAERLQRVAKVAHCDSDHGWLLKYRASFRRVIARGRVTYIKIYLLDCPSEMIPLCLWLWSECADRFRLYGLGAYSYDPSPRVRKIVAKSLRRLEAWKLLQEMAAAHPDDAKVHWFAKAARIRRSFPDRLQNYKQSLEDSHAGEAARSSPMPYWAIDKSWDYTPPKSVLIIRRMLHRIRHWVRWGVS
jgi:hypothetical protein